MDMIVVLALGHRQRSSESSCRSLEQCTLNPESMPVSVSAAAPRLHTMSLLRTNSKMYFVLRFNAGYVLWFGSSSCVLCCLSSPSCTHMDLHSCLSAPDVLSPCSIVDEAAKILLQLLVDLFALPISLWVVCSQSCDSDCQQAVQITGECSNELDTSVQHHILR
jgi:hypothetical protein